MLLWICIFGCGCCGIYVDCFLDGCCIFGVYFIEKVDYCRVKVVVVELILDVWEKYVEGIGLDGWIECEDGECKICVVDGVCVFLNFLDFLGGYGCVFYYEVVCWGVLFYMFKFEVCW